jgi:hypothetical protein
MIARLEEVATYDDEGRVEGMQFDSRERRIQQWKEKKEDEEFDRLIAKLRQKKNWRAWYDRHKDKPDFRERLREQCRVMRVKHGPRRNAAERERRKQEAEAKPIVNICEECGKEFVREFGYKRKRTAKFCSRSCRNRCSHKKRDRNTAARKEAVYKAVLSSYSVTAKEATAHVDMCQASVQALLNVLVLEGRIRKHTEEKPYRYSIW